MGRHCYVLLRRHNEVRIRRRGGVQLRHRWVFYLRRRTGLVAGWVGFSFASFYIWNYYNNNLFFTI